MVNTLFESVRNAVTAEEAAHAYGLEFGRNGRALCPWHADKHPDLTFYNGGARCYCHACHNGGDAIALTAQLFSLTPLEAARKLNEDFSLNASEKHTPAPAAPTRGQKLKALNDWRNRRFSYVCDVEKEARRRLDAMPGDWENPAFRKTLAAMSLARDELELLHTLKREELPDWIEVKP